MLKKDYLMLYLAGESFNTVINIYLLLFVTFITTSWQSDRKCLIEFISKKKEFITEDQG
jgi:hypothetical protein